MTEAVNRLAIPLPPQFRRHADILHEPPQFIELLPIAIYACDGKGRVCWFNRRAVALWGQEPKIGEDVELFLGSLRLYRPNGQSIAQKDTPMSQVLKAGIAVHGRDTIIERPDGSRIIAMVHIDPVHDEAGQLIGAINCFHDITAMKAAERLARDSERRLRDLLEALPVAIYTTDVPGYITSYNEAAAELWQVRPIIGESQWCGSLRLYTAAGEPMAHSDCPMALTLKGKGDFKGKEAVLERKDGTRIPFLAFPSLLRDGSQKVIGAVNMMIDISERRQAEERQKSLMDELNHRVKNTLATVQSLAANTAREAAVPPAMRQAFEGRLITLSRTHDQLTRTGWQTADLSSIIGEIFAPYLHGITDRITISGKPVSVVPRQALALAMVFNELAANALRHGSLSVADGRLRLSWLVKRWRGRLMLRLEWKETGGPPASTPDKKGFGTRLIERSIVNELRGAADLKYGRGGLSASIKIPLG
jgi:PAS domain S-box-containing protein